MDAKERLQALGLSAKKRFSQNFLHVPADLVFIAESLGAHGPERVLEIGPGLGALTEALLDRGLDITAVEKDSDLVSYLQKRFAGRSLRVFSEDILKFDPERDAGLKKPLRVAGNIPYSITSPILFWLVAHRSLIKRAVLTVQKEVAERLTGKPGHEAWGALSVSFGAYADARLLRMIPRSHFHPAPKVDSAVVGLDFLEVPRYGAGDGKLFHELVARAFQKRRKTLLNSLEDESRGRTKARLLGVFAGLGFDPKRRPETLSVEEWVLLAGALSGML